MNIVSYDYMQKVILLIYAYLAYINFLYLCMQNERRFWTHHIFTESERELHGFFNTLFKVIKEEDDVHFRKATRMGVKQYKLLLTLLEKKLTKKSIRKPISAECRLIVTLM